MLTNGTEFNGAADLRPEVETEFLFEARIPLHAPIDAGQTPEGRRMIFLVGEGSFNGPKLKGRVIPMSGADWARIRPDGSGALDVRMCLKTDDGAVIFLCIGTASWQ